MEFFSALIEYEYLSRALITSVLVGALCGIVGSFTILRGLALMGDAVSHAVLPGIATSFLLGIGIFPGALAAGLLTTVGIGYVHQNSRLKNDAALGIVFTTMFALGVVLVSLAPSSTDLNKILFGNVLAVRPTDMWSTLAIGTVVLLTILALYKELKVSSFDPTMAAAYGLSTKAMYYLLMTMLTLVTVASLQTVGVILVVAMLIIPASAAYLLTERLSRMIFLSAAIGVFSAVAGLYFSYRHNLPSGAVIVLAAACVFALSFVLAPRHGLVRRLWTPRGPRTPSTPAPHTPPA